VEYAEKLARAGFEAISIEPTRVYNIEDAREFLNGKGIDVDALAPQVDGKFMSAFVRAVKPLNPMQLIGTGVPRGARAPGSKHKRRN
jgi:hypothetical protein